MSLPYVDVAYLHAVIREELGVNVDDALAAVALEEMEEVGLLASRARVGGDGIDVAHEGIVAVGNVILIGTAYLTHFISTATAADEHHVHVEIAERAESGLALGSQPVGTDDTDDVGVALHHVNDGEVGALGIDVALEFLAVAEAVAHVTHSAGTAAVEEEFELALLRSVGELLHQR